MGSPKITIQTPDVSRREFILSSATAGAGMALVPSLFGADAEAPAAAAAPAPAANVPELKIAMIGVGSQGRVLLTDTLRIPGIRFAAICDIWPYHQEYAANILKKYDQPVNVYSDYQDMLAKEKVDCVVIATPDWMHAEQTMASLKAGMHVYCEKEMSNTLEDARKMVNAAREAKKLLQIGHQRRSNVRYQHAMKMLYNDKILGRITHFYGQWNRSTASQELGWPKGKEMSDEALKKYGYDSMERFKYWRWYKRYSGGPFADLGSHQIDVFSWFLKANPKAVTASGGNDYYKDKGREWYDHLMAIYAYDGATGPARGFYQVLNTTSYGNYYELIMGDEGTLMISEDTTKGSVVREMQAKKTQWEDEAAKVQTMGKDAIELKVGETRRADGTKDPKAQNLAAEAQKKPHQLHLENFFDAVRANDASKLTCPGEVAYETTVAVLKANDAADQGKTLSFDPKEFKV